MDNSQLSKAKKIAEQLAKLPVEQRPREVEKLCGSDVDLRASVERLLKSSRSGESAAASKQADQYIPKIEGYEIIGRLGEGAMGVVWEAVQLSTRRRVALKLLSQASLGSQRRRTRFVREVELAASLEHSNIARVYDSGLDKGVYYYAMQLVKGLSLDKYVKQSRPKPRQILGLMRHVCNAMEYAHARGVVHRDLKPSNILVDKNGQPHILDFGLAKLLDEEDGMALSIDGDVTGTPMYMSPEQAAGTVDQISARTDVYALGIITYRLLTGQGPHDMTGSYLQVIRRVAEEEVRPPHAIGAKLEGEIEAILLKALSRSPADRYSSAKEMGEDIGRYLAGDPISARQANFLYLAGKRLKKHRRSVLAAMLVMAVIGIAASAYLRDAAERIRAQEAVESERRTAAAAVAEAERQRQLAQANLQNSMRDMNEMQRQLNAAKMVTATPPPPTSQPIAAAQAIAIATPPPQDIPPAIPNSSALTASVPSVSRDAESKPNVTKPVPTPSEPIDLDKGLVLHFSFDEKPANKVVKDDSGNGNDGHLVGALWTQFGVHGGVYLFRASSKTDAIIVPSSPSLNPEQITLSAWIETNDGDPYWNRIIDKDWSTGYDLTMGGDYQGSKDWRGKIGMEFRNDRSKVYSDAWIADGNWHHVVGTYDGADQKLYIDGQQQKAIRHFVGKLQSNNSPLRIGNGMNRLNAGEILAFDGFIDDVRIYNRALSAAEVVTLAKLPVDAAPTAESNVIDRTQPAGSAGTAYVKKMSLLPFGAYQILQDYRPQTVVLSSSRPAGIKNSPKLESPLYGTIHFGVSSYIVAIDEPEGKEATLYVDANGNGDLNDDPRTIWRGDQQGELEGNFQLPFMAGDTPVMVTLDAYQFGKLSDKRTLHNKFMYYRDYAYEGEIVLGGVTYRALLTDENASGYFRPVIAATPRSLVNLMIDENEDGTFDRQTERFDATKPFKIRGNTWVVTDLTAVGSFNIGKSVRAEADGKQP